MAAEHHVLNIYPVPREKSPMFINEPWIIDKSIYFETKNAQEMARNPEAEEDNIRVYLPMDLNKRAILRRLSHLIVQYGEANEENELDFAYDVDRLISRIEIYDQIWYARLIPNDSNQKHSDKAIELVKEFLTLLEGIPDGCAERFPFETIDELRDEYLGN